MLNLVERYVLRASTTAFVATLLVLTAIIWLTTALRQVNLLTLKGQSLWIFFAITSLSLPLLIMVIAPIALFIAVMFVLNRLNGDSELIVMSAAGLSPARLARPFLVLSCAATLVVGGMSLVIMPWGFRVLRDLVTEVQADFIANVVRPGTFTTLEQGFVFHYRERAPDGALRGIFIQDRRDPNHIVTYLAERGATDHVGDQSYLVLADGSLQREDVKSASAAIVVFKSYQIDLTQLSGNSGTAPPYRPRERSTLSLLFPDPHDSYAQDQKPQFRAELTDRFTSPLYALVFGMVGLAALAQAKTTRQGRGQVMIGATFVVLVVRVAGFAVGNLVVKMAAASVIAFAIPLLTIAISTGYVFWPALAVARPRARALPAGGIAWEAA